MGQANALRSGHEALTQGRWDDARGSFATALESGDSAEALEGLARAAWWADDAVTTFAAREQAYRCYREGGDRLGAARMALHLGIDHCAMRDSYAVGTAWLGRAMRLLDGLDPAPEHAWLALWRGQVAMVHRNDSAAADLARSLGLVTLERLAQAQERLSLARDGDVAPGPILDDNLGVAMAGDLEHLDLVVIACSQLMHAWEQVRDFDAIEQWWAVLDGMSQEWPAPCLFWLCRIEHAAALMWRGAWDEAESELRTAADTLLAVRGEMAAEALLRLATLARRRGRYEEGAALLEAAEAQPLRLQTEAHILLGWADLALDEGDPVTGRNLVDQALAGLRGVHPSERIAGLELLVHAEVAFDKRDRAHAALAELQRATCSVATDGVRAAVRLAEGIVALGADVFDSARSRLEEAVELYERASAPFEAAQARIELAVVLDKLGDEEAARHQAAQAKAVLHQVGAAGEAGVAEPEVSRTSSAPAPVGRRAAAVSLTIREVEVLDLVARGQSNDTIAAELIVSRRTVERHLSNIYDKVGVVGRSARAAAVAHGMRGGLLRR